MALPHASEWPWQVMLCLSDRGRKDDTSPDSGAIPFHQRCSSAQNNAKFYCYLSNKLYFSDLSSIAKLGGT